MFHFNVRTDVSIIADEEGIFMPSVEDAIKEARRAAQEMVVEAVMKETRIDGTTIEVTDGAGELVGAVPLISVLKI
jgi:hypothetical protein